MPLRRNTPKSSSATTIEKMTAAPTSITHQSVLIVLEALLWASKADCPPPQPASPTLDTRVAMTTAWRLPRPTKP
jgi:hypothetical protein